jgi:hypothetical protein
VRLITAMGVTRWNTAEVVYLPGVCERVRMTSRAGVFLVVSVDLDKRTAELMPVDHVASALDAVPFSDLQPHGQDWPPKKWEAARVRRGI